MSAWSDFEVRELDKSLAEDGEWVELQRLTGTQLIAVKCRCRAKVRNYDAKELIGGLTQDMSEVIISSTEIIRTGWPGPDVQVRNSAGVVTVAFDQKDRRVPRKNDKVVIQGKTRNIEVPKPTYVDDGLVRIMLVVAG